MAIETRNGQGGTTYLQLDFGRKSMYIYSGEEKEGFEKHTTSTGKVSYRQYVNAVSGIISGAYFRENNFGGTDFILNFTDEDSKYSVQISIEDSVFQVIARSIKNIDVSKVVRMAIYESKGKTNGKSYFGVSLSYPLELDENDKAKLVEWGEELPKGKQLRNGKWDFSAANDEAYGRVEDFIKDNGFDNFDSSNSTPATETQKEKPAKSKTSKATEEVDDEDLPF
jgi:hypothetical protein